MGRSGQICWYLVFLCCIFLIPVNSLSHGDLGVDNEESLGTKLGFLRRDLTPDPACPEKCQKYLQEAFNNLSDEEILKHKMVDPTTKNGNTSLHEKGPGYWCADVTYLSSAYLCFQQHCTELNRERGWAASNETCGGKLPTEKSYDKNMGLLVIEVDNFDGVGADGVKWHWTKMWATLAHTEVRLLFTPPLVLN